MPPLTPGTAEDLPKGPSIPKLVTTPDSQTDLGINKQSEVERSIQVDGYTLLFLKDAQKIVLCNEFGAVVPDLDPIAQRNVHIDWMDIKREIGARGLALPDGSGVGNYRKVENLPGFIRTAAEPQLKTKIDLRMEFSQMKSVDMLVAPDIIHDLSDRIIIADKTNRHFIVFQVKDDTGAMISPRNWERTDSSTIDEDKLKPAKIIVEEKHAPLYWKNFPTCTFLSWKSSIRCTIGGDILIEDNAANVGENVCIDPQDPTKIFYCSGDAADRLIALQIDTKGKKAKQNARPFAKVYKGIRKIQMDPPGNFFIVSHAGGTSILDRNTLKEIQVEDEVKNLQHITFGHGGSLRGINPAGQLIGFKHNLDAIAAVKGASVIARTVADIDVDELFATTDTAPTDSSALATEDIDLSAFDEVRTECETPFIERLKLAANDKDIANILQGLERMRSKLKNEQVHPTAIAYATEGVVEMIRNRQKELAEERVKLTIENMRERFKDGLTLEELGAIRADLEVTSPIQHLASTQLQQELLKVHAQFEKMARDVFAEQGKKVEADARNVVHQQEAILARMQSKREFDDWHDTVFATAKRMLSQLLASCPPEAIETFTLLTQLRTHLGRIAENARQKFTEEGEKLREVAVVRNDQLASMLETDIEHFFERLRERNFRTRAEAEGYIASVDALKELEAQIADLAGKNSDKSQEINRALKVNLANFLYEIERRGNVTLGADGREMERFGSILFPKFEAPVPKRGTKSTKLIFVPDEKTKGPGIGIDQIRGDVAMHVTTSVGDKKTMRLWQGLEEGETTARYGLANYKGEPFPPSYMTMGEFRELQEQYGKWKGGKDAPLHKEQRLKRDALRTLFARRDDQNPQWREQYLEELKNYGTYAQGISLPLLRRIAELEAQSEPEFATKKILVPQWQSHWVIGPEDEAMLEKIAKAFLMQSELQEGILNLAGHTGAGKDVLLKIFCNRTRRPLSSFDCSKWTSEFELAEDVILDVKDGASYTLRVPSSILLGIQTPGCVTYLNEFNAMPEQAQIFLHALLDEKRSMTLKTKSGETVRGHASGLLACSMNPGYPGTFDPQKATRSRMVTINVPYPALTRKKDANDHLSSNPYSVSEALKIARVVPSLSDTTVDPNMERNEFVKLWDYHVNHLGTEAKLTKEQTFDMDVTLALVQFAHKLREQFISQLGKSRSQQLSGLPVEQPITLREMRRCAYLLGQIPVEQKKNADQTTRDLLEIAYLSHIDDQEKKDKVANAMKQWTLTRRTK